MRLALAVVLASVTVLGATERVRLDAGWKFLARDTWAKAYTFDRMAAWLDDMGRDLMADPGPSRRPARDPEAPFAAVDFKDSWWRTVRVPHDRALDNGFAMDRPSGDGCVEPFREGWYRRTLDIPASAAGKRVFFECDGAASFAMVWINGRFVGGWPYAYTPWRVELTPHVAFGGTNVVAVRTAFVKDAARYYVGAGLYRDCHLAICDDDHLVPGSVAIRPVVDGKDATVAVSWEMSRSGPRTRSFTVKDARLWDVDDPFLHSVEIEGETFRYGIRTAQFFADTRGFQLNGRRVPVKGVCLHQDLDVLGAVWNRSAWRRRLLKLKEAGCNAVRMSHYRHPAGVYDLCDELGLLVMDETFDQWNAPCNENDYHRLFPRWHERDLRACIRANRNHPSIVLWGLGNEISEQRTDMGCFDPALFARTGREMMRILREEDPTRPGTTANNNEAFYSADEADFVDVYGFNYRFRKFGDYRKVRPGKPTISTETGCYIATRGEYFLPIDRSWRYVDFHSSSYLQKAICTMEEEWGAHDAEPSHTGGFYWTGFDYLGGPAGTYGARRSASSENPADAARMKAEIAANGLVNGSMRACATGLFDLAGFPRDVYWQFKARWRPEEKTLHLLPHWNWHERVGQKTPVMAFTSGDEVELFLNGVSQGRRKVPFPGARVRWDDVAYAPGTLSAVAYRNGATWCETKVETTGAPAKLALAAESETVPCDGASVAFVNLSALDDADRVVPRSRVPVKISVEGGELVGVENGDEADLTHPKAAEHVAFNGHLSVVVRAKKPGDIVVKASSPNLPAACATVRATRVGRDPPAGSLSGTIERTGAR